MTLREAIKVLRPGVEWIGIFDPGLKKAVHVTVIDKSLPEDMFDREVQVIGYDSNTAVSITLAPKEPGITLGALLKIMPNDTRLRINRDTALYSEDVYVTVGTAPRIFNDSKMNSEVESISLTPQGDIPRLVIKTRRDETC